MDSNYLIAIVLLVFILVVYVCWRNQNQQSEHFDTYWNHTIGAQEIYKDSKSSMQRDASKRLDDTELLARYTWAQRSPDGQQLYDRVYESDLQQNGTEVYADPTYFARDLEGDYLSLKFQTMNTSAGDDQGPSAFAVYDKKDMLDNNPMFTVYNGEYIHLNQKSF